MAVVNGRIWRWTPERDRLLRTRYNGHVRGRAQELAELLEFPTWAVKKRAKALGLTAQDLTKGRKQWTIGDTVFLFEWTGQHSSKWIARQLGRTETSVIMKLKHLRVSRRVTRDHTCVQAAEALGVDHKDIARWVAEGRLEATRMDVEGDGTRARYYISDRALLAFIRKNPTAFRLYNVQQLWFLRLVLGHRSCAICEREISGPARRWRDLELCRSCFGAAQEAGMV